MFKKGSVFNIKFSQNFIQSPKLAKNIINLLNIDHNDQIVEIGPGNGILTSILLFKSRKVIAIEKDKELYLRLKQKLKQRFKDHNLELINNDFLEYPLHFLQDYKVVGNIPFNITSNILNKILNFKTGPISAYIILQREAALMFGGSRLNTSKETLKSILAYPFFDFKIIYKFHKFDFSPTPKVDSVLLFIQKRKTPLIDLKDEILFKDYIVSICNVRVGEGIWNNLFSPTQLKEMNYLGLIFYKGIYHQLIKSIMESFKIFKKYLSKNKQKYVVGSVNKLKREQLTIIKINRTRNDRKWYK